MTLTIKDPLELTGQSNAGSSSQNSEHAATPTSSRSNPVCLEVPVTIRSLPGEHGKDAGAQGPVREEGRTVIVFDSGAVLRISKTLPAGQTIILSNQQGRDVVCKVGSGRNLPSIKGYIEVEFIEAVDDFWHVHQDLEPSAAPPAVFPHEMTSQPSPSANRETTHGADSSSEPPSGNAPSFEDIAGLVRMSPPVVRERSRESGREKKIERADPLAALKITEKPSAQPVATPKPAQASNAVPAVASSVPAGASNGASSVASAAPTAPSHVAPIPVAKPTHAAVAPSPAPAVRSATFTSDLTQPEMPVPSSSVSPTFSSTVQASSLVESKGRMPMILGGAALVLLGFGASFLFMHRGSAPAPSPIAATSEISKPSSSVANIVPVASSSQEMQQAPRQVSQPVSTPVASSSRASEMEDTRSQRPTSVAEMSEPARTPSRASSIANLNMKSPKAPGQGIGKAADASSLGEPDVTTAAVAAGASNGVMLSSVARGVSQPAPPPTAAAPRVFSSKSATDAKLLSSTRPLYPEMAKQTKVQGNVVVAFTVDAKGNVTDAKAVSGPILLREAAVDAIRKWKYTPSSLDGRPMASQLTVSLDFRMN